MEEKVWILVKKKKYGLPKADRATKTLPQGKFQAIAIGPKTNSHNLSFDLKGNKIICEENVKLLGVTINSQLNLDKYISEICKKKSIPTIKYP